METFKELVPSDVRDYTAAAVVALGGCYVLLKVTGRIVKWISKKRLRSRWANTPKDVVILHRIPAGLTSPNLSPFVLKLETYLRMTNISYQNDMADAMGEKGKTPWITLNGEHIADSQLCIEFLAKKFEKRIGKYSDAERATSTMVRLVLDEHFYWGLISWRYIHSSAKGHGPETIFPYPKIVLKIMMALFLRRWLKAATWAQGLGRHSEEDIVKIITEDLRTVSTVLGNKKFILGDEPCEDDCAIFGELAQVVWGMPGSPYEKLLNEELHNLKQYCLRMKETYWPDWDNCLAKK